MSLVSTAIDAAAATEKPFALHLELTTGTILHGNNPTFMDERRTLVLDAIEVFETHSVMHQAFISVDHIVRAWTTAVDDG